MHDGANHVYQGSSKEQHSHQCMNVIEAMYRRIGLLDGRGSFALIITARHALGGASSYTYAAMFTIT